MVESGLLEEEDVAEEVGQLKGEAKAWRVSTAASGALVGRAATLQPLQRSSGADVAAACAPCRLVGGVRHERAAACT